MLPLLSKSAQLVFACEYASANGTEGGVGGAGDGAINPRLNYDARRRGEWGGKFAFMPGIVKHEPRLLWNILPLLSCIHVHISVSAEMSYGFKHLNAIAGERRSEDLRWQ